MLRHARSKGVNMDWTFYCTLGRPGDLDEEVRQLGGRIVYSPVSIGSKWSFLRALRAEFRSGAYDVLHAHHDLISGIYLAATVGLPLKQRLVHIHNADESLPTPSRFKQSILRPALRHTCLIFADRIIGISNHTLDTFLSGRSRRSGRDCVHYYGIDPTNFLNPSLDRHAFRQAVGLPEKTRILLFAGRIVPEKNPIFAVEVFAEMKKRDPHIAAVFAGTGSLEDQVEERARELGVYADIRMLGWRSDVPDIMTCCDWFILPRPEQPMEGFGIAVVEAQLAGLRLLLSKGIPDDPLLPDSVSVRMSLNLGPAAWADQAIHLGERRSAPRHRMRERLQQSRLDLNLALQDLQNLYE